MKKHEIQHKKYIKLCNKTNKLTGITKTPKSTGCGLLRMVVQTFQTSGLKC